jgi:hypothetical protein
MVKEINDKRKIKQIGNVVKPGEHYIHPLTLQFRTIDKSSKDFVPTEFHFNPQGNLELDTYADNIDIKNLSKKDLQLNMLLPKTFYNEAHLLKLYDIENIDSLNKWIQISINKDENFDTINRIVTVFAIYKIEEFKNNNNNLVDIYQKLFNKYFNKNINKNELSKIITEKINKYNSDDFELDLVSDIIENIN